MEPEHSATTTEHSATTSEHGATPREPSDAQLITEVRAGDREAYGVLWGRHESAARNLARQIAKPSDVDELVSESFYRVLRALDSGGGPDSAFRPYLLSTLRRVNIDTGRGYYQRVSLTADGTDLEGGPPGDSAADITIEQGEQSAAWVAWASLPESSRTLLWHLIVEEETPAQIAPLMGTTPNGVSSRAVRAKERLRQAFLQQHVRLADTEQCEWTRLRVGEYVRHALSNRERDAVERHLKDCKKCKAVVAEITDVNETMKVLVVPIILGGAAVGYLHAIGASHGLHLLGLHRAIRPSVAAGTAGAVAVAGIIAGLLATDQGGHPHRIAAPPPSAPPAAAQVGQPPVPVPTPKPATPRPAPPPRPPTPSAPGPTAPAPTATLPVGPPTPPTNALQLPAPTSPGARVAAPAPSAPGGRTPPPLTPPPSTAPPPPASVTSVVDVQVFIPPRGVGIGRLVISVPATWRITDAHPQSLRVADRCTVESPSSARCRVVGPLHRRRDYIITVTGPRTEPPPVLHAVYTDVHRVIDSRDYQL
jgi:RNA polymerase sigma factor (sigma-70 family)